MKAAIGVCAFCLPCAATVSHVCQLWGFPLESLGFFFIYRTVSSGNKETLASPSSVSIHSSPLVLLGQLRLQAVHWTGENGNSFLVPDFSGRALIFSPPFLNVQLCMNPKSGHVCWELAVPLRVLDSRCLPHAHKEMCFVERYSQCCPLIWEGTQSQCLWNSPMSKLHYFVKGKSYWKFSKAWQWMTAT